MRKGQQRERTQILNLITAINILLLFVSASHLTAVGRYGFAALYGLAIVISILLIKHARSQAKELNFR
jgi:hypothetical protein